MARDITGEAVTVVPARTVVVNTAAGIITAAHDSMALTPVTVARAIYYDGGSYPTTATTRVGRIRTGATAHPGGYYPYSYYGGYPYSSYTTTTIPTTRQRTLITHQWLQLCSVALEIGYYHAAVDAVIGPQIRGAIAAFESRNGLVVDGRISRPLLDTLGLG